MGLSRQVIESLPKIELHRHLDGDIKPDLIFELAKEQNIKLPVDNKKDLNRYFSKKREEGFNSLITDGFGLVNTVLQTGEALRRAAYESVRNMKNENIIYGELRFAPELHTEKGLSYKQAIYEARMGMKEAEKDFGISTNLISCICRNSSAELGEQIAKTVMDSQMYTVALDLACDEANNPPEKHKKAYELTFNTDIKRTVHAGELGNNQYQNMVTAINTLHADRISHAIHISEYKDLINIVREKNIGIEELKKAIWDYLGFVKIYLVEQGQKPNQNNSIIAKKGETLFDITQKIGTEFAQSKKEAEIWGVGAKFPAQKVSMSTKIQEGMIVRFL